MNLALRVDGPPCSVAPPLVASCALTSRWLALSQAPVQPCPPLAAEPGAEDVTDKRAVKAGAIGRLVQQPNHQRGIERIEQHTIWEPRHPAEWFEAEVDADELMAERSDLVAAAHRFVAVVERRHQTTASVNIGALTGLAVITALQGVSEGVVGYAEEAQAFAAEVGSPFPRNETAGSGASGSDTRGYACALESAREIALDVQACPDIG
jgi:hypothetical protein